MSQTPQVTLRPPEESDADVLFRIAAELDTWEERGASSPAPLSRASWESKAADRAADDGVVRFMIDVGGRAVGIVLLFHEDTLARHAEMGINLLPEERGRGIGTAAILQVVEFAFVRRNLRRVHLEAIASNTGALRAYEKAGFVEEGRLREHAWVRGRYEDIVRMGILRSEWRQR